MPLAGRLGTFALAILGASFASCLVDGRSEGHEARIRRALPALASFARAESRHVESSAPLGDTGKWPEPSAEELAELTHESGEVRTASATTGDVLSDDGEEADDAPAPVLAPDLPAPSDAPVDPDRALAAIAKETFVRASPHGRAKKIGYLRGGAVVGRSPEPVGYDGCPGGWYRIVPMGYVCVGKHATLDVRHPLVTATTRRPDRLQGMPYAYGMSLFPTPPFYTRVPSQKQQAMVEQDLTGHLRQKLDPGWDDVSFEPIPEALRDGREMQTWNGTTHSPNTVYSGRALPKSGFAFLDFFESEGRKFGLTVDLDVVPLDRLKRVVPSSFRGIELGSETALPVVFVMKKGARLLSGDPNRTGLVPGRELGYREAVAITGKRVRGGGRSWLETRSGDWIEDQALTRVDPMKNRQVGRRRDEPGSTFRSCIRRSSPTKARSPSTSRWSRRAPTASAIPRRRIPRFAAST